MQKRDSTYQKDLDQFIAESLEAWGWYSDEKYQDLIASWAEQLTEPDITEKQQKWIRVLIKALKDERVTSRKQLTKEFMLTRRSLVKGIKYDKANNCFKARMVYSDVDPRNKNKFIEKEEEMRVEEAWVRDEFSEEDVQHIINMRLEDNWIQAPRDIEVWIGKQKIVRVRYMGPRQRSIVDYDALAERWRQQFGRHSSMLRAKRIAYKKRQGKTGKEIWSTKRTMNHLHEKSSF